MIRFDSISSSSDNTQPERLRVLLPGDESSGNDAQVRAQLLRADQRSQAFDVDTPLVVTPTGEIHYQTSLAAPENQPQIQIARRLPRSETSPVDEQPTSLSPEQQQLLVALPWKFIEQAALSEEVRWEKSEEIFYTLSSREKHVAHRRKLQRLLLSDRQEDLDQAEQELLKLPHKERQEYAFWLLESGDQEIVNLSLRLAESLHLGTELFTKMAHRTGGTKPFIRPPQLLLEVAQEHADAIPSPEFFERQVEMVDKGKRGGRYEVVKPSRFETLVQKIVEPLGEMKVNLRTWNSMMRRVDEVIDVVRYGSETLQIDQPSAVEAILESLSSILARFENEPESSVRTWDLLTKFVIPESLVPQTLEMMIRMGDTDHALAFFLLSRLPEDHPLLVEQRAKAEQLRTLCEGEAGEVAARFEEIAQANEGLISVFPDAIPTEKVGFDYEFLPQVAGLPVPYGMELGLDGGYTMPELRCLAEEQILQYTQEWRQRQFGVWLWSKTAQAREVSIHLHVDRSENEIRQKEERFIMWMLFGRATADYTFNFHPHTHEVRSALEGYGEDGVKGFPDGLNCFRLAELLVTVKNAQYSRSGSSENLPAAVAEQGLSADRFFNICRMTQSVEVRAATISCLLGHFGNRIKKTETADEVLFDNTWMESEAAEFTQYEESNYLEARLGAYKLSLDRGDLYSAFFFAVNIISWLEVYETDQDKVSSVIESMFGQLEGCFQHYPNAKVAEDEIAFLWQISKSIAQLQLPTTKRIHLLLKLKDSVPPDTAMYTQRYIFQTISYADDLSEADLNQVIDKMLELATDRRDVALSAFLNHLPEYPLSRESLRAHLQKIQPEIQPLFDEEVDRDQFRQLRQVQRVSFLKIAQATCETEEEFVEYFRVIARTIPLGELTFLLQSCEYWFTPDTHWQLIRKVMECGLGYKRGETSHLLSTEESKVMNSLFQSCDRLVTDKESLYALMDMFIPEDNVKSFLSYTVFQRVAFWIKKLQLSHKEFFKYLQKKSVSLASEFLQNWDEFQQRPEETLTAQSIPELVNDLHHPYQWKKIVYSE